MCKEEDPAYEPDQPYLSQPGLTVSPSRTVPRDGDLVIEDFPLVHDGYNCKSTNFNSRFGVCTASSISKAMSPTATHTRCQLQHTVWLTCLRSLPLAPSQIATARVRWDIAVVRGIVCLATNPPPLT